MAEERLELNRARTMRSRRRASIAGKLLALVLLLATACGSLGGSSAESSAPLRFPTPRATLPAWADPAFSEIAPAKLAWTTRAAGSTTWLAEPGATPTWSNLFPNLDNDLLAERIQTFDRAEFDRDAYCSFFEENSTTEPFLCRRSGLEDDAIRELTPEERQQILTYTPGQLFQSDDPLGEWQRIQETRGSDEWILVSDDDFVRQVDDWGVTNNIDTSGLDGVFRPPGSQMPSGCRRVRFLFYCR